MTAPFDPARWLHEFEAAGGAVSLTSVGHLCATRQLADMTPTQLERSWALQKDLYDDQAKLAALWSLMQRQRAA